MDWLGIPDYQRLLDIELNRAQDLMGRLEEQSGSDLSGTNWETEVIGTAHDKAIADVASTREADEIIVGTRGYGWAASRTPCMRCWSSAPAARSAGSRRTAPLARPGARALLGVLGALRETRVDRTDRLRRRRAEAARRSGDQPSHRLSAGRRGCAWRGERDRPRPPRHRHLIRSPPGHCVGAPGWETGRQPR
jgi:hypothetical protein